MKKAIIGKKVGMTQIFDETGKVIPVTVIEAGPCVVVAKMNKDKEGYDAVQFGYEEVAEKKLSQPEQGHLKKAGVGMVKHIKEFRLEDSSKLEVGDVVKADVFAEGDKVSAKVRATPALSSASARAVPPPATAAAPFTVTPVPWAPAPILPAFSRARSRLVTWASIRSPSRTSTSSRSTLS